MGVSRSLGYTALVNIFVTLICIFVCWRVVASLQLESLCRTKKRSIVCAIILSIVFGYQLARFIIDYLTWAQMLPYILDSGV